MKPLDLGSFVGSPTELKWNRKDLGSLEEVLKITPGRRVAVQAGGCLGVFAKRLAQEFEAVYVFEPSPELFPLMVRNAPEGNIIRFQAALGNMPAMVSTECSLRGNDGKTILHPGMTRIGGAGIIPVMRLDSLALNHCDLIYLDIEGWELFALQGARETIQRHRPVIACEINRGIEYLGYTQDDVRVNITMHDYERAGVFRSDEVFAPRHRRL